MTDAPKPRRTRRGLGCLPTLALLALAIAAVMWLAASVMGPWVYTVGGRHRWLPIWEGVGDVAGPGGTYRLYVWFAPWRSRTRYRPEAAVEGYSTLCTPRGERFNLTLRGGAPSRPWLHMDDQPFHFRVWRRPPGGGVTADLVGPPRLEFAGRWQGPNLVMDDQGSVGRAFNPDATLNPRALRWETRAQAVAVTFAEQNWGLISPPACPPATVH